MSCHTDTADTSELEDLAGYPELLGRLLSGMEFMPLLTSPELAKHREAWRSFVRDLIKVPPGSVKLAERFRTKWHESHHRLRELLDNDRLMLALAKTWLPAYTGPDLELYRGENLARLEQGRIGMAWTDQIKTAEMFASGLNAAESGGVLLRAKAPNWTIISGPSSHSLYLGESEFTVDPYALPAIEQQTRFNRI